MKVVFRGKLDAIERIGSSAASDAPASAVRFKVKMGGRVAEPDKMPPNSKDAEIAAEFVLRPVVADEIRIGQAITITIDTEDPA